MARKYGRLIQYLISIISAIVLSGGSHKACAQCSLPPFFNGTTTGKIYTSLCAQNKDLGGTNTIIGDFVLFTNLFSSVSINKSLSHFNSLGQASYGYLHLEGRGSFLSGIHTPPTYDGYNGNFISEAAWRDNVTISKSPLNGTGGYLRASVLLSGILSADLQAENYGSLYTASSSEVLYRVGSGASSSGSPLAYYQVDLITLPSKPGFHWDLAQQKTVTNGVATIDIPFTFGQQFSLYSYMYMRCNGFTHVWNMIGAGEESGESQLQWLGALVLDANSNVVSEVTLASEAGIDWLFVQPALGGILKIRELNVLNQTNLIITGTGGTPSNQAYLLSSTNIALDKTNWSYLSTNIIDVYGHVSFTNVVIPSSEKRFFKLGSQ